MWPAQCVWLEQCVWQNFVCFMSLDLVLLVNVTGFSTAGLCHWIHLYIVTSLHHTSVQILIQHIQHTQRTCSSSRSMTPSSSLNLGHSCQHLDYQLKLLPDPATLPSSRAEPV